MKRMFIAMLLLFFGGLSTGCSRPKDEVLPDGTKLLGEHTHSHYAQQQSIREAEQEIDRQTDRANELIRLNGYDSGYAMEVEGSSLAICLLSKPSPERLQAIKDGFSCGLKQIGFKEYLFTDIRLVTENYETHSLEYVDRIKTPLICKQAQPSTAPAGQMP